MLKVKIKKFFTNLLFPEHTGCIFCDNDCDEEAFYNICSSCLNKLPANIDKICKKCGKPLKENASCNTCKFSKHYFKKARAPFVYEGVIKAALHNLKFNNYRYLAKSLAYFLFLEYTDFEIKADVIIPLPLSQQRMKERGYNQAALLSEHLGVLSGLSVNYESLVRVKHCERQSNIEVNKRKENVTGAFKVRSPSKIKGKIVVLVDDIFTTGATVNSACMELVKAGVKAVYVLTVAHTNNSEITYDVFR